jgi:hypothetical protein
MTYGFYKYIARDMYSEKGPEVTSGPLALNAIGKGT